MSNAIGLEIHGIQCDACDYKDETVNVEDYENWVNKPCPECGANLLTEADYQNVQFLIQIAAMANSFLPPLQEDEEVATMTVSMNGTGDMILDIKE